MRKIRTAIIGCGKVGHIHAEALKNIPESDFVAVCDPRIERAKEMALNYGVQAYSDVSKMVGDSGVEAVIICTPHPVHSAPSITAMQAGANVLVEKPLASTLEDCDAMITAQNETGLKLGVISQRRLYPPVRRVREAIDAGKIGVPVLGMVIMLGWRSEAYYQSDPWRGKWQTEGGGVLVNQSPHQLDILQWLMGPIDEVFGYWDNLNHPYIEVEDTAIANIRFKSGGLGSIIVSNSQKPGLYGKVHIHGKNGASIGVQTDGGAMFIAGMSTVTEPPINDLWTIPGEEEMLSFWQEEDRKTFSEIDTTTYYHQLQDQDFLQAILEDRDPLMTGLEGRKTVELFTAIYRSQRDNLPIKFPLKPEIGIGNMDGRIVK